MFCDAFVGHVSDKNMINLPAIVDDDSLYFGDFNTLAELDVLGVDEDSLISHVHSIVDTIDPLDLRNSRHALVFKLGGNILKLYRFSDGDALTEAVVMEGLTEGLEKTNTEDNDNVKVPRFIAGAKIGRTSLVISQFIPNYLPIPDFGTDAVVEFTKTENHSLRLQRYYDAKRSVGLLDNMDAERWNDLDLIDFFDDALTNTLWPIEFKIDPSHLKKPNDYYRIDFGSFKIPRQDIVII